MATLQEQYNSIKSGNGNKDQFLKHARSLFPEYFNQYTDFNTATNVLKSKQIISEAVGGVVAKGFDIYDWKKILAEEVKAEEKETSKEVTDKQAHAFQRSDMKNTDNVNFNEIMKGFYAEMRDEKNAGKTGDEIKAMVVKNLAKDPLFYTKDGMFGEKGVGYTTEAPGLGQPKEPKGKHKASGYGDLDADIKIEKVKSNVQDSLGDKEAETSMPKKVKEMPDKGVTGVEKKMKLQENKDINWDNISAEDASKLFDYHERTGDLPDSLPSEKYKEIMKKYGISRQDDSDIPFKNMTETKLREGNLGHNETWSLEPEGRFWILTYSTMNGKKEKTFNSENEAKNWIKQNLDEVRGGGNYGMMTISTKGGGGGKRFVPPILALPGQIFNRFANSQSMKDLMVFEDGTLYVSGILYNNLMKGANNPYILDRIKDIPQQTKILLTKSENYKPFTLLKGKSFKQYFPFKAPVEMAKEDKFNKDGSKQYWSKGDLLLPNLNALKENEESKKLTISGIEKAISMLKSELKNNGVKFETDGNKVMVDDSPKAKMAIKMVKERVGMQSIKINENLMEQKLRSLIRNLIKEELVNEISPELFKRATDVSRERGQDRRTMNMGETFFNKFKGKSLMGGTIANVSYIKPQSGDYEEVIVEIKVPSSVVPGETKSRYIYYDVRKDQWGVDKEIIRADARLLSLIAQQINPDTKYKSGGVGFDIKGY